MLSALLSVAAAQINLPQSWYGPVTATFRVEFAGNPYDPDLNDLRVKFVGPKGETEERLAYFDGHGAWKAELVTQKPGKYKAVLYRNGKKAEEPPEEGVLDASLPMKVGYLHVDPVVKNRFRRDTGQPYYPIGFNLGWRDPNLVPMTEQVAKIGKAGANWTRIWSSSWDGKNPWWPQDDDTIEGQLWVPALDRWDEMIDACESSGVACQFVLFNHGSFSSKTDPNWPDHPWNAAKGGFLKNAADFFTDAEAKRRTKMWLRYAVARYGSSPQIMAWELFNEVQWVDAVVQNRWHDVTAWHKEMADYIRGLDPYHHMVTTSSVMEPAALWTAMDYVQPHTYPANVVAAVSAEAMPKDKPGFFGEFGPSNPATSDAHRVARDGIYAGMLANHAGTAMYWYWDAVERQNLYPDFAAASKVLSVSDLVSHTNARRLDLRLQTAGSADLVFAPGGGWGQLKRSKLSLPADVTSGAGDVPEFFQGQGHRDLFPQPLTLSLTASQPGILRMRIGTIAKAGAEIKISVNGKPIANKLFPATDKDHPGETIEAPYPAGAVTITIANDGADWVQVQSLTFTNAGPQATGIGLGESDWAVIRLAHAPGVKGPVTATVNGIGLAEGDYQVTTIDAATGESKTETKTIKGFRLADWPLPAGDTVLVLKRR